MSAPTNASDQSKAKKVRCPSKAGAGDTVTSRTQRQLQLCSCMDRNLGPIFTYFSVDILTTSLWIARICFSPKGRVCKPRCRGSNSKYFRSASLRVSMATLNSAIGAAHRGQQIVGGDGWAWLCSNKIYLQKQRDLTPPPPILGQRLRSPYLSLCIHVVPGSAASAASRTC